MYKHILLPVDLNHESSWRKALPVAVKLAEAFAAKLTLVTVVPDFGMSMVAGYFPKDFEKKALEHARDEMEKFVAEHVPASVSHDVHLAHGSVYEQILASAGKFGCDLIVMGSHRPELKDYLLGPNAERVTRHSDCSVMIVRD